MSEPYFHGPCAVIAKPRHSVIESFEQNPAQARTWGTASADYREPLPVLPQPATENAAQTPEPWCVRRRTCKGEAFSRGLWQAGRFW